MKGKALPKYMSLQTYKENILPFASRSRAKSIRIGIIGGEPTLHPDFKEIIRETILLKKVDNVNVFTNGLNLEKFYNIWTHPKITFLLNLNSPEKIGRQRFEKIIKQLDHIVEERFLSGKNFKIGVNIHEKEKDYSYVVDTLNRYNLKRVRVGIAAPNTSTASKEDPITYFRKNKKTVFNFFKQLKKYALMPVYDCNKMPLCVINKKEKNWLKGFFKLEDNDYCNILDGANCTPVVDILPDLTAIRCFGLADQIRASISAFEKPENIREYFDSVYDSFAYQVFSSLDCKKCILPDKKNVQEVAWRSKLTK